MHHAENTQLAEVEPPLDFEERDEASSAEGAPPAGSCATGAAELDVPRLWRQADATAMLEGGAAAAPPSTPLLGLGKPKAGSMKADGKPAAARIAPGSKDPKKLRRTTTEGCRVTSVSRENVETAAGEPDPNSKVAFDRN